MTKDVISRLSKANYSPAQLFFGYSIWLGLVPPVSAFFGTYYNGWSLGISDPIKLSFSQSLAISIFYALALIVGFLVTAFVIKWMATVYAPESTLNDAFAVVSVVGTPIMLAGVVHLYPSVLLHIIVLSPIFAWSCYILFCALPILLKIDNDRGIFMGCAVLGFLVTAFLALLGISTIAWVYGIGPNLGV
ncbi:MAG TPA: DUF1282 domain-containing protein [Candidatus Thioglobus sp.]|jgi:hypothetical protein|nr:DUF1282 domain-containing protein [Candidatus Thioglobus sp.]HIL42861.1 DUF1282 domain-containing protein [Gammaproteobacteria bacterium]